MSNVKAFFKLYSFKCVFLDFTKIWDFYIPKPFRKEMFLTRQLKYARRFYTELDYASHMPKVFFLLQSLYFPSTF
jgi:hypothetical protein